MILSFAPRLALLGLLVLVSACQSFPDGERRVAGEMDRSLAESLDHSQTVLDTPLPSASSRTPVEPPPAPNAPGAAAPGADAPRFDVLVSDMPARSFFLSLMDSAGQNILVHPQVSGDISLSLRQVTLPEVLSAVRDSYGYDYRRTSYGYQIQPNQAITRTYDLNYLNVQRQGMSDTRVSSGQVTTSDSVGAGLAGTTSSSTASTVSASHLMTSSNADFWKEVQAVVAMIIGGEEGNSVVVNPQAGLLVVRANSADQQNVADFLDKAQRNLQRQV
ncbi:MAG TPA: secretin N-terminal domain-containing protein, partial [Pseudomonas sp.]|nr:secretin N-terminal domain-containing protein [Pseudomonas sp.]